MSPVLVEPEGDEQWDDDDPASNPEASAEQPGGHTDQDELPGLD